MQLCMTLHAAHLNVWEEQDEKSAELVVDAVDEKDNENEPRQRGPDNSNQALAVVIKATRVPRPGAWRQES